MPRLRLVALFLPLVGLFAADHPTPAFSPVQRRLWSLQPVARPPVPTAKDASWAKTPIDAFILARLEAKGIRPAPPADRITLLRRVTLDLTGLPPTQEQTQAFLADTSAGAYAKLVDRLLQSPRYGERWARHWLDLARYADSEGFKSDETRPNVWRYRDYVIRAFNQDKPYNRFVQEQIAGDEMFPGNIDALIATGFNRHFPDEYNARNLMQRRQEWLNDITDTVGATFLGLTVGCARCHDHKFDPILQRDYYRLQSFFAATHSESKMPVLAESDLAAWQQKRKIWEDQTAPLRAEMTALVAKPWREYYQDEFEKYPEEVQKAITREPMQRTPYEWQLFYQSRILIDYSEEKAAARLRGAEAKRWKELKQQLAAFDAIKPHDLPVAEVMIETGTAPPATHLLNAGAWDAPREVVQPGFLTILDPKDAHIEPLPALGKSGRRSALARWLTDPANPLTARVIVNRVWHYHFGRGIAATPSDFGIMGERPTHAALLDDLTARFVQNGWSLKQLHREIVLSAVYRQASDSPDTIAAGADPDNKLLWRYPSRRLEGEAIRDAMLDVSGLLNAKMYGPGVFPPLPAGVETRGGWKKNEDLAEAHRRSVYIFVRRNTRYPMLEAFDMPDTHESCGRRNATVTPLQALELLNSEQIYSWSQAFAARVANDKGLTESARIDRAWRLAYARPANDEERAAASAFLARQAQLASTEAALADLCHSLLISNEFLTLR